MSVNLTKEQIIQICSEIKDNQIKKIEKFVVFVGHAHSGHSIVGALIDAHQDAAISNHVNVPKLILDHNLTKTEILKVVLYHSLNNDKNDAWINTGYNYQTYGNQGKTKSPIVIGDKQGGASTRIIRNNPEVLLALKKIFKEQLHLIFVHRNPLDNIAAFSHYMDEELSTKHVDRYFENLETVGNIKNLIDLDNWFQLDHKQFSINPENTMKKIFGFLNLSIDQLFIDRITEIVNSKPNKRRDSVDWNPLMLKTIQAKLNEYSQLI